jgi:hypothetical protein
MKPTTPIAALCLSHHALGSDKDLSLIQLQHQLITEMVHQKILVHTPKEEDLNYSFKKNSANMLYGSYHSFSGDE